MTNVGTHSVCAFAASQPTQQGESVRAIRQGEIMAEEWVKVEDSEEGDYWTTVDVEEEDDES